MVKVTFDSLVTELRELRLSRDKADARMLLRLFEIERDHMQVVMESGCDSFAQFAEEFVKPARYEAFKGGLAKVGVEQALTMGSDATIEAGKTSDSKTTTYVQAVDAWRAEHNGTLPTRQTAKYLRMQVDPREEQPKAVRDQERREDELSKLRTENADLRAKLRAAEAEVARLRKQLGSVPKRERMQHQPHARGRKEKPKG